LRSAPSDGEVEVETDGTGEGSAERKEDEIWESGEELTGEAAELS
jgi:hypothetical protein